MVRRQGEFLILQIIFSLSELGRSFQNTQLSVEVSHPGACQAICPGMEGLGHFQAFNTRATNSGKLKLDEENIMINI